MLRLSIPLLSLLLLPVLLTPTAGLAATESQAQEEEVPARREGDKPLRLLDESELPAEQGTRASVGGRIAVETGMSLLTSFTGFLVGSFALGPVFCSGFLCINEVLLAASIGIAVTAPLGAWVGGTMMGGDGNFGLTFLGSVLGALVGLPLFLSKAPFLPILALLTPIAGSMIGYELSVSPEPPAVALGGTRLQPLLSISPQGSFVGLGGHF
jgi:hypothetical protein